ncbi:hypothetical protein B0H19DRAFT_1176041 [Mycena capillaripes]|nr:hypothetical protein B0H19DRAFT_1176041 [Mycena capillaripes]
MPSTSMSWMGLALALGRRSTGAGGGRAHLYHPLRRTLVHGWTRLSPPQRCRLRASVPPPAFYSPLVTLAPRRIRVARSPNCVMSSSRTTPYSAFVPYPAHHHHRRHPRSPIVSAVTSDAAHVRPSPPLCSPSPPSAPLAAWPATPEGEVEADFIALGSRSVRSPADLI